MSARSREGTGEYEPTGVTLECVVGPACGKMMEVRGAGVVFMYPYPDGARRCQYEVENVMAYPDIGMALVFRGAE